MNDNGDGDDHGHGHAGVSFEFDCKDEYDKRAITVSEGGNTAMILNAKGSARGQHRHERPGDVTLLRSEPQRS